MVSTGSWFNEGWYVDTPPPSDGLAPPLPVNEAPPDELLRGLKFGIIGFGIGGMVFIGDGNKFIFGIGIFGICCCN